MFKKMFNQNTQKLQLSERISAVVRSSEASKFMEAWKEMSAKVNHLFVEKKRKVAERAMEAQEACSTILKPFGINNDAATITYHNYEEPSNIEGSCKQYIDPIFSLDTGACVPKGKYDEAFKVLYNTKAMFKSLNGIVLFQGVSGIGKTHFVFHMTKEKNKFCFILLPWVTWFRTWSAKLRHCQNREEMNSLTFTLLTSHLVLLALLLDSHEEVDPLDFLYFQVNGGGDIVNYIFNDLILDYHADISVNLQPSHIAWCIDEAHLFHAVKRNTVPRTNSSLPNGSALTVLVSQASLFGPAFLTTTLSGLLSDIENDVSDVKSSFQVLPPQWPTDVRSLLNQVVSLPSVGLVDRFVCNQLVGVARFVENYFNLLIIEANKPKNRTSANALLLRTLQNLFDFCLSDRYKVKLHPTLAERYKSLSNTPYSVTQQLFDEIILFGSATIPKTDLDKELTKLSTLMLNSGLCFDYYKSTKEIFLVNLASKCQLINTLREEQDWLETLWVYIKKNDTKSFSADKIAELLQIYLLTDCYESCIAPLLKNHEIFKHYTLITKYWWHDIPFSKLNKRFQLGMYENIKFYDQSNCIPP